MVYLKQIESDLIAALKARNQLEADTLRALKTRIQNEQIAKMKQLEEQDIFALVQSEVKRRKEAAESFEKGDREEAAKKELAEAEILARYLPAQATEAEIIAAVGELIVEGLTSKDFGKAMGTLKTKFGSSASGATLSKILKDKLK